VSFWLGCRHCDTAWAGGQGQACWMCGAPSSTAARVYITSQCGFVTEGIAVDVASARGRGPDLAADPCGGGPL